MNYQKIVCWGDSQTFGARTYGCYPLYLVRSLNHNSRYIWNAISFCANGYTARDLWFRFGPDLLTIHDAPQACILIGANDVVNPAARRDPKSPIYGMPIIDADKAKAVLAIKRSMNPGFAGIDNELYFADNTLMLFGDAKTVVGDVVKELAGETAH